VISTTEKIQDKGKYTFYPDYQPICHIYPGSHGYVNVTDAIRVSCNYFFYETGRLLGIDKLYEYTRKFGLGELTGIELPGEEKGISIDPEYRKKNGSIWYPGDTLQVAIGQSDNLFSPLQLANYLATVANGGTRFRPRILSKIREQGTGHIRENAPETVEQINIKPVNYQAVMEGMRSVTEDGTASAAFHNFEIPVGGKTGTAEVPGTNNGLFVAFAPYDNPKIAVAVVVEHGEHGNTIAPIAREIIAEYFEGTKSEIEDDYRKFEIKG
jgi:penicillin-binding protein 2